MHPNTENIAPIEPISDRKPGSPAIRAHCPVCTLDGDDGGDAWTMIDAPIASPGAAETMATAYRGQFPALSRTASPGTSTIFAST